MAEKRSSSGRELWPPPAWAIPQACDTMQEVAVEEDKVLGAVRQVPEAVGDEETATCPTRWAPLALGEHAHSRAEDAGGNGARHVMVWGPAMEEPSFVNRDPLPASFQHVKGCGKGRRPSSLGVASHPDSRQASTLL